MANTTLEDILERLRLTQLELENELDRLLAEKRDQFQYQLQRGKVIFKRSILHWQQQQRTGIWRYLREAPLPYILSAPFVYSMIVPLVVLDITISLYQHICFRIYRIPRVQRADYFIFDRYHLAYLNAIEKMNCFYCSYANGLIGYVREVTARTEQYWCPIKHARRILDDHQRMQKFFDYGDAEAYKRRLEEKRKEWNGDTLTSQHRTQSTDNSKP